MVKVGKSVHGYHTVLISHLACTAYCMGCTCPRLGVLTASARALQPMHSKDGTTSACKRM